MILFLRKLAPNAGDITAGFYLGWPAFIGVRLVFYLMVAKPAI